MGSRDMALPRVAIVLLAFGSLGSIARAEPLSLPDAVALARRQAPEVQAVRAGVEAARGRRVQAGLLLRANPELSGEWADDRLGGNEGERRIGVELSQAIEIAGQPGLRAKVHFRDRLLIEPYQSSAYRPFHECDHCPCR